MPAGTLQRTAAGRTASFRHPLVCDDSADRWLDNPEGISDGLLGFPSSPPFLYFKDVVRGEFGSGSVSTFASSLLHHVSDVVSTGSQEEVLVVDTGRDIAGVADDHALWDWAVCEFPCVSVGEVKFPVSADLPVAVRSAGRSLPYDASRLSLGRLPEKQIINIHANTLPR